MRAGRPEDLVEGRARSDHTGPRHYTEIVAPPLARRLYPELPLNLVKGSNREDVDIEPAVERWATELRGRVAPDTIQHYLHAVRTLIPAERAFPRSRFSARVLGDWLAGYPGRAGTVRKAHAAMMQLARYLVSTGVIAQNPLRDLRPPVAAASRCRWLEVPDLLRLAGQTARPYHTLSALLGGTGLELSVALTLHARDVDLRRKEIRAPGTRVHARDRIVRVAEWAWPYVFGHVVRLAPDDRLFPNTDRWRAQDAHAAACRKLGIEDYTLRDHRHSYAVRAARAGTPPSVIARQLGHASPALIFKVYGPFMPGQDDRDKWERIAAVHDAERDRARAVDIEWCTSHEPYRPRVASTSESSSSMNGASVCAPGNSGRRRAVDRAVRVDSAS
ncbi:MAG: hypothetical protein NVS1B4_09570 [Gemmatimonadaceae bacterium]